MLASPRSTTVHHQPGNAPAVDARVVLPPAETKPVAAANVSLPPPSTASPQSEPQQADGLLDTLKRGCAWTAQKCSDAACFVTEKCSELKDVRSLSDLGNWASRVVSEAWTGIRNTFSEASQGVSSFFRSLVNSESDSRQEERAREVERSIAVAAEAAYEKKQREKERELAEVEGREKVKRSPDSLHHYREKILCAVECAPKFIDRETLQNIQLAILTNQIPPEKMPEVRRFLALLEEETARSRPSRTA